MQRIAFQGVEGAFSHEALRACLPDAEPLAFPSFQAVFDALAERRCDRAFVPVENTIAGPVPEVAALLPASGFAVLAEHPWPIRMQLMGSQGATLGAIRTAASHPMALKQCGRFLQLHAITAEEAFDTAGAAEALARSPDPSRAAIGPRMAAALYGLQILAADIQDQADNTTRFLLLGRPPSF